jgi:hypothetical protein
MLEGQVRSTCGRWGKGKGQRSGWEGRAASVGMSGGAVLDRNRAGVDWTIRQVEAAAVVMRNEGAAGQQE